MEHRSRRRTPSDADDPTGWKAAESLIGFIDDALAHMAERHDQYLYGAPNSMKSEPPLRRDGPLRLVHTGPTDEKGMPQDRAFIQGGLMKRDPSASSPVLVIAVDDGDATVDKVKKSEGCPATRRSLVSPGA